MLSLLERNVWGIVEALDALAVEPRTPTSLLDVLREQGATWKGIDQAWYRLLWLGVAGSTIESDGSWRLVADAPASASPDTAAMGTEI